MAVEPRVHELKSWPMYFTDVARGVKRFEVRFNDRDYRIRDALRLLEFDPARRGYTGREVRVLVTYVMPLEPMGIPGFVGLGIEL